jgi:hypothetical protein
VIRARFGALLAMMSLLAMIGGADARAASRGEVWLFLVPGASFEELLAVEEVNAIASNGGAALLSLAGGLPIEGEMGVIPGEMNVHVRWLQPGATGIDGVGEDIADALRSEGDTELLVMIASTVSSTRMIAAKDEAHPIVFAQGSARDLLEAGKGAGSLTSDSTLRDGVVVDVDVWPSIAAFFGVPPPADATGEPIEIVAGPPPFELHERYLAQRRMYVPVGTAAALYVTVAGLFAIACTVRPRSIPPRWRRVAGWASLSVPMLAVGLLAAGHLAELTYATAVPMIAIVTVFGTLALSPLERADVTLVPAGIGVAVLALFVLEALLGWDGMLTPLLGGSQLDGGRFYGLPNVAIGLLAGAALWVAQRLPTWPGFGLLSAVALFAGLPLVGSNLGGGVTLFAAAGLWLAVRERARLGLRRGVAVFAGVTVLGTLALLLVHAASPVETHVTRFAQNTGGLAGVVQTLADRWQVGLDLIGRNPAALVPVLGLPLALVAVLRPPAPVRAAFERSPAWRDAVLVTILAGAVAYLVNDSGPAAAGLAFGLGLGGMLGVPLLVSAGKMGGP